MKKKITRVLSFVLSIALAFSLCGTALADFSSFTDVRGHWAEATLEKAYNDGLIQGYSAKKLGPGDSISTAQMITILCRVLGAVRQSDISGMGIGSNVWFHDAAAQAVYLGFLSTDAGNLNQTMSRLSVMLMMSDAFQLEKAEPDETAASAYPDFSALTGRARRVVASLVDSGYIEGYNGKLHLSDSISRAEFLTILYRVAENYIPASELNASLSGGSVLSGDAVITNGSFGSRGLWAACSAERVSLDDVSVASFVIRSDYLASLSITGSTSIGRLVLAQSSGDAVVAPAAGASVDTAVAGFGDGAVSINSGVKNVEVTGSGRSVTINSAVTRLVVTGANNSVTIASGGSVGSLLVLGEGNAFTINGSLSSAVVSARGCSLRGSGHVSSLTLNNRATVSVSVGSTSDSTDHGIEGAAVSIETARDSFSVGDTLVATATVTSGAAGKTCTATWYVGGTARQSSTLSLERGERDTLSCDVRYVANAGDRQEIYLVLSYTTTDGEKQEIRSNTVTIDVNADEYLTSESRILNLVTTGYKGDWTLSWAENNDYEDFEKEIWINAKGYSSKTEYLIWISIACQRVNIFSGSRGNWTLERSCLCGTGAYGRTPTGAYTVTYKQVGGWTTGSYTCAPVIGWKTGSGYAFHSRLYYPGTDTSNDANLKDATIGMPCSHGCIRMYTPDVWWIFDNIPIGTTVVSY